MALYLHQSRRQTGPSPNSSESTLEIEIRPPAEERAGDYSGYNYSGTHRGQTPTSFFPEADLTLVDGYNAHYQRRSRTPDPYYEPPTRRHRSRRRSTVREERLHEEYRDSNDNVTDARDTFITTPLEASSRDRRRRSMSSSDRIRETETIIERRRQYYTDIDGNPAFIVDTIAITSGDSPEQRARDRRRAEREARREREGGMSGSMPRGTGEYSYDGLDVLDRRTLRRVRDLISFDPLRGLRESRR
ncbi:hypothetical protein QBC41DRAFT_305881 [Cercophora samala]|uniref:Uncharacterized protein n=1 Tax=Cercophora samala TaxID=330535 RepID=A0AA39Z7S8_9PEZI|nr:hypothetical protein QBC41DRAFT_305881 [Cercophora samala]